MDSPRKGAAVLALTSLCTAWFALVLLRLPETSGTLLGRFATYFIFPFLFPMLQRKEFESWRLNHPKKESAADWTATGWALLGVVGLAGIFFGVSMLPFVSEVRDVEAAVFAPTAAIEHEKFEIVVQVENTAAHPQTVQEVGIERSFLTGVTILETDPPFTKTHRNVFPAAEVYELNQNVPANSKATILLRAQATRPGEHGGTLAVCMNYTTNCLFYDLKLKVAPKE